MISIFTANTQVLADPLSDSLKLQQQLLEQSRSTYDELEDEINSTEAKVQMLDEQIGDLLATIDETDDSIKETNNEIKSVEEDIKKSEDDLKKEQELFEKRIKAMYMSGAAGYMNVLLQSVSFGDFISRIEMISKILNYDNDVMSKLKVKKDELNQKKLLLAEKNDKLLKLQHENSKKFDELNSIKSDQQKLIAQLKEKQKQYASTMAGYQHRIDSILKQIQSSSMGSNDSKSQSSLVSRGENTAVASSGNDIVAFAVKFLGVSYVWGGSTPAGFDCSGFTSYVFSHFGVSLYRRAADQSRQGKAVSRDSLMPGDLVFFGKPAYHVGIYIGDGLYIHAPETGDVVKISPIWWTNYSGARRVK